MRTTSPLGVAAAIAVLLLPALASAQAWVPAARQLSVYTGYQYLDTGDHLLSEEVPPEFGGDGSKGLDLGDIKGQTGLVGLDFGINDRLAASASIAFVASKYEGVDPESPLDNGSWNTGFQDVLVGLRWMAVRAPVVVTPSVQVNVPSHSYDALAHTALGRNLNELRLGVNVGWVGRSVLPGLYLQGGYTYSIVEQVLDFRPNRSDASLEAGYFLTQKLIVRATGSYSHTHDGIDWFHDLTDEVHLHAHDQGALARSASVGGGLSYSFGASSIGVGAITMVSGENTHESTSVIVSMSRSFNLAR